MSIARINNIAVSWMEGRYGENDLQSDNVAEKAFASMKEIYDLSKDSVWTPCSVELPEIKRGKAYVEVLCYIERISHGVKLEEHEILRFQTFGTGKNKHNAWCKRSPLDTMENITVLAWQPLPAPYNPDHIGDTNKKVED